MPDAPRHAGALHRVLTIAWREFRSTVLTKGFLFSALAFPLLMVGVSTLLPILMATSIQPMKGAILVDAPASAIDAMRAELDRAANDPVMAIRERVDRGEEPDLDDASAALTPIESPIESIQSDQVEAAKKRVRDGDALALVIIPPASLDAQSKDPTYELFVATKTSPKHTSIVSRSVREAIVRLRVQASGADYQRTMDLLKRPEPNILRLTNDGAEAKERLEGRMLVPGAFMLLMWLTTFTGANYLLTSTIEEKGSKVIEVLLAAVSPMELLAGKILGQLGSTAVMLGMYGMAGLAGLSALAMMDLVPVSSLLLMVAFALTAYLMIASMLTAVGSAVTNLQEAQALVGPVMIVLIVPLMLWLPISENPNGAFAVVCSFVPPISPFIMVLRATGTSEPVPGWQVALSLAVSAASSVGFLWLASRIFRVGILMQGKPPTPRELLRWARYR
ncbi:MAG: ABC transporter permease [Phycisphaerae bacterium]|nr:ABC transporter permease [Phycisphaerae bacterium]